MTRRIPMLALYSLTGMLLATQAHAQCPANVTNPLQVLAGTWSFRVEGLNFGGAGVFTASVGIDPRTPGVVQGLLSELSSSNSNGIVARQQRETSTIKYEVNSDCSGGTITLIAASRPIGFDFYFAEGFSKLYLVSIDPVVLPTSWVGPSSSVVITGVATHTQVSPIIIAQ